MRVAFYAPLKSPDHAVPSGDRRMGRALLQALRAAGHEVSIAAHLRSFDGRGDGERQVRLGRLGTRLADRLSGRYLRTRSAPEVWFTYHLHHKAPDWLGPRVSAALDIPYVVAEASIAPKQRNGPWAVGYAQALHAIQAADAVVFLNPVDVEQVMRARSRPGISASIAPFLDVSALAGGPSARGDAAGGRVRLITVAMMREGAKLESYRLLAAALARLPAGEWELVIVGDGPARGKVERLFARFSPTRVKMTGELTMLEIGSLMRGADVFAWPAVDEAFGMVFLEAQACGLPVVAGDAGGVRAVVADERSGCVVPVGDVEAFAAAMRRLLDDGELRARMGLAAREYVQAHHDMPAAARRLDALLSSVVARHRTLSGGASRVRASC